MPSRDRKNWIAHESRCYPFLVWKSIQAIGSFSWSPGDPAHRKGIRNPSIACGQQGACAYIQPNLREGLGRFARLVVKTTPLAFTSATYGRSYTRRLPMLPLPSDPSGKSDIALKYKQRNKSQQSDPPRLLFFFSILHNLYSTCILR